MRGGLRAGLAWGVAGVLVAGAAFWSGSVVARPAAVPSPAPSFATYTVQAGEVGFSQHFTGSAQWVMGAPSPSPADGTVTTVDMPADGLVAAGQQLFSVNLRPVFALAGTVPAFRDLTAGVSGADVEQLQQFLVSRGARLTVDGKFGAATTSAVKEWQSSVHMDADGLVRLGDVIFVPTLPARLAPTDALVVGAVVSQGLGVVEAAVGEPVVIISVTPEQATTVPLDAQIVASIGGTDYPGVIASREDLGDGTVALALTAVDGSPLCGASCSEQIPVPGPVNVPISIVVVPQTAGIVVPVAAITTDASGSTFVDTADGARPITIVVSSGGLAVVDGLTAGDQVRISAIAPTG